MTQKRPKKEICNYVGLFKNHSPEPQEKTPKKSTKKAKIDHKWTLFCTFFEFQTQMSHIRQGALLAQKHLFLPLKRKKGPIQGQSNPEQWVIYCFFFEKKALKNPISRGLIGPVQGPLMRKRAKNTKKKAYTGSMLW